MAKRRNPCFCQESNPGCPTCSLVTMLNELLQLTLHPTWHKHIKFYTLCTKYSSHSETEKWIGPSGKVLPLSAGNISGFIFLYCLSAPMDRPHSSVLCYSYCFIKKFMHSMDFILLEVQDCFIFFAVWKVFLQLLLLVCRVQCHQWRNWVEEASQLQQE
jgi:hypothetical protein